MGPGALPTGPGALPTGPGGRVYTPPSQPGLRTYYGLINDLRARVHAGKGPYGDDFYEYRDDYIQDELEDPKTKKKVKKGSDRWFEMLKKGEIKDKEGDLWLEMTEKGLTKDIGLEDEDIQDTENEDDDDTEDDTGDEYEVGEGEVDEDDSDNSDNWPDDDDELEKED